MKPCHIIAILCISLTSGYGNVIIDSTTLNGSFESGEISPWGSGGSLVYDPDNAPDGDWYAQTVATVNRAILSLFFDAVDPASKDFSLTFSARVDDKGFEGLTPYLYGRSESNEFYYASIISNSGPDLSENWGSYTYTFRFMEDWDITKRMSLGFHFSDGISGSIGFIDQVTLYQIPEPNSIAIYAGGIIALCFSLRNQKKPNQMMPAPPSFPLFSPKRRNHASA